MLQYFFKHEYHPVFTKGYVPRPEYICNVGATSSYMPRTMHSHPDLVEILLVYEGAGIYIIDRKRYTAKKGDLILYNSNTVHDEYGGNGSDLCTYCLGISNLRLLHLDKNKIISPSLSPIVSCDDDFDEMISLFQAIENNSKGPHATEITVPLSQALIAKTCSIIEKNAVSIEESNSPLTTKVIKYIDEHYKEEIRLKDIAAATKISIYYLSHVFKADVGFSPMQYVILRRIGEAQSLLINTDLNITHVATIVGYNNSNYFQNVFRKLFGITPGEYRRKWKI